MGGWRGAAVALALEEEAHERDGVECACGGKWGLTSSMVLSFRLRDARVSLSDSLLFTRALSPMAAVPSSPCPCLPARARVLALELALRPHSAQQLILLSFGFKRRVDVSIAALGRGWS